MKHHCVNEEDDDDIKSGSTSSLNFDTDSNDFLVPEYENRGPDPDDFTALKWGREHYTRCFPRNILKRKADRKHKKCATHVTSAPSPLHMKPITITRTFIRRVVKKTELGTGTCT